MVAAASSRALSATTYSIQRIGLTGSLYQSNDGSEQENQYYANTSGVVIGSAPEFNGSSSAAISALWEYPGSGTTIQLGLTGTNGSQYQRSTASYGVNTVLDSTLANGTRIYNNGYVAGVSSRYDASGTSEGPDAWIFNGSTSSLVTLPSLASSGSNSTYSPNLAYRYVNSIGDTIQAMGGGAANGNLVLPGGNGSTTGLVTLYYNSGTVASPTWTAIGGFGDADAFYSNGTNTIQIGLIGGSNVNTVGATTATPFDRASIPIQISTTGVVFGYSKFYGGSTLLTSANGQDLWLYDPSNATGTGANGTMLIAPSSAPSGDSYTGGNSSLPAPAYPGTTSGQYYAAAFQMFANSDLTARTTALAQDTFLGTYNGTSVNWTQIGLTGSQYTFYQGSGSASAFQKQSGFGGSNIGTLSGSIGSTLPQYPPVNSAGDVIGYTRLTNSNASQGGVITGQDAWVYYPAGHVPAGATAGTTQIGLTGGAYTTTGGVASGVKEISGAVALSTNGAVAGLSQRYTSSTVTTTAGQDAWYYDPAHGITTATQVGLTGSEYEFNQGSGLNNYRSSTVTAMNNTGMVGGTSVREPSGTSSTSNSGYDAWVYSAGTKQTYNVDPNTSSTLSTSPVFVYSTITYISDSGVALGYQFSSGSNTGAQATNSADRLFDWYLGYNSGDGTYDIPTFQLLTSAVDPASLSAENWSQLYSTLTLPSLTSSGNIVGFGQLASEDSTSYVPFVLTPESSVPEPASLGLLSAGGLALLGRRRRNRTSA